MPAWTIPSKLDTYALVFFCSSLNCETAIIEIVYKVMYIAAEILEVTLWQMKTFWSFICRYVSSYHNAPLHFWSTISRDFNFYFSHPIILALWQILLSHKNLTRPLIRTEILTILHFSPSHLMMIGMNYALIKQFSV